MKRRVGITALIFTGVFFLLSILATVSRSTDIYIFALVMFWGCGITAIICLFGYFIRYIGKMFALGWNDATEKHSPRYCPHCGRGLEQDACFCPGCGSKIN